MTTSKTKKTLKERLISRRMLNSIAIPLVVTITQIVLKYSFDAEINYIGISLAAVAFGQILPFIHVDHLINNKVLTYKPKHEIIEGGFKTVYNLEYLVEMDKIESLKIYTILIALGLLGLFVGTIGLGLKGCECIHNITGAIAVLLNIYYQVFM